MAAYGTAVYGVDTYGDGQADDIPDQPGGSTVTPKATSVSTVSDG